MDDDDDIEIERKKDGDDFNSISEGDLKKKMSQHMAIKIERKKDNDIFNTICERDLKKNMSQHVTETFKSNSEDENSFKSIWHCAHMSGPKTLK
jgi:hypothetical protein